MGILRQGADPALGPTCAIALGPSRTCPWSQRPTVTLGDHRLRPGHPPGRAHPGRHGGAPGPLRGHRGGAVGRGPPGRWPGSSAATGWERTGEDIPRTSPWRTSSPPSAGWWTETPRTAATRPRRTNASPHRTRTPSTPPTCGPPCLSRQSRSEVLPGRAAHPRREGGPGPFGRLAPMHHRPTGRADGRGHPQTGQPGATVTGRPFPGPLREPAPRCQGRGAALPGPPGPVRSQDGTWVVGAPARAAAGESPRSTPAPPCAALDSQHEPPARHQHRRRRPERRGRPV